MSSTLEIRHDPLAFAKAITNGEDVCGDAQGNWYIEGAGKKMIRKVLRTENTRIAKIGRAFNACLTQVERTPVLYETKRQENQKKKYEKLLEAAKVIREYLDRFNADPKVNEQILLMDLLMVSLKYRIEGVNGGFNRDKNPTAEYEAAFIKKAEDWKRDQELYKWYVEYQIEKYEKELGVSDRNQLLKETEEGLKNEALSDEERLDLNTRKTTLESELVDLKALLEERKNELHDNVFDDEEKAKVLKTCQYPEFIKLFDTNPILLDTYFKWIIRDRNEVKSFVQFPAMCELIHSTYQSGRIGRFLEQCLKVEKLPKASGGEKKVLTLPIELQFDGGVLRDESVSILKESKRINTNYNFEVSIKELFDDFLAKSKGPSNFEYRNGAIRNYNTFQWGPYNPELKVGEEIKPGYVRSPKFDEENSDYWQDIAVFESISKELLELRYGLKNIEDGQHIYIVVASREYATLNVDKSHGYSIAIFPDKDIPGNFRILPMGKFAWEFPVSFFEKYLFLANTVSAQVALDDNEFYSNRSHAYRPFLVTEAEFAQIMERKRKDIKRGFEDQLNFAFSGNNCGFTAADDAQKVLGRKDEGGQVSDIFKANVFKGELRIWPINEILKSAGSLRKDWAEGTKNCPDWVKNFTDTVAQAIQEVVLRILEFMLMSWRGRTTKDDNGEEVWTSTATSAFRNNREINLPAILHENIREGKEEGHIIWGSHPAVKV